MGLAALLIGAAITATSASAASKEIDRVASAAEVMDKIMEIPEKAVPPTLMENAQGIAIIPGVIKVGFVLGGQYGRGVLVVRGKGGAWSDPVFVSLMSGSVGWQIGAESTDVELKAEIYAYSRSRGAFAGVSLEGSALQIDDEANAAFYGRKEIRPATILEGGKELRLPSAAGTGEGAY